MRSAQVQREIGNAMIKRLLLVVLTTMGLLATTQAPAQALSRSHVAGHWDYTTELISAREIGCRTILTLSENDTFSGSIEGHSNPDRNGSTVILHCDGSTSFIGRLVFDDVTVNGRTGSITMNTFGRLGAGETEWHGIWYAHSGRGELRGSHGFGSWWGPGAGGPGLPGELDYAGIFYSRHPR